MMPLEDHTATSLRYLDDLRTRNLTWVHQTDSNVIQLSQMRLCHLTSMLPSTSDNEGTLQPDYGLYTEGAGLLALLHFNQRDPSIVSDLNRLDNCNVQLTMSFGNTQFSPMEACRVLEQEVVPIDRPHSLQHPYPISLVGATRSAVTAPLANVASVYELPVVSYGSTSSQLNLRDSFPYFGRTVPTNQGDALAAASYFRNVLGVTHMGVLFVKDAYGSAFHKEFLQAAKNGLDPPMQMLSSAYDPSDALNGDEGIQPALKSLLDSGYKFFYGIISTPTYNSVMRQAYQMGLVGHTGMTWILSGSSGQILGNDYSYDAATEADLAAATSGLGVISLNIENNPAFEKAWSLLEGNQAIKQYFVDKHDPALNFSQFQFYDTPTYWEYLQYDAVMALGFAACEASNELFSGPELFDSMMNTLFRGASGLVEFDAATGTRKSSSLSYKITNVVAREPQDGTIYFDTADTMRQDPALNSAWVRIPQSPAYVYADGSTVPPPGLPPLTVNMHLIGTPILVVGLTLAALCILLSLACAAWTQYHRNTQVVRVAQPFFLRLICAGTLLMACSVIPMSFQEPLPQALLDVGCMAVPWMFSFGWLIAFSALLSKTLRIYRLLQRGRSFRRVVVRVEHVLRPFFILTTLNFAILLAWNITSPLQWARIAINSYDEFGRSTQSFGTCQSDNQTLQQIFAGCLVGVDLLALMSANIINYKARQISSDLHEAGSIAVSMVILLEAALIGLPALLAVRSNPPAYFLIRSVVVSIVCGAILFPIFSKWQSDNVAATPSDASNLRSQHMSQLMGKGRHHSTVAAIRSQAMRSAQLQRQIRDTDQSTVSRPFHPSSTLSYTTNSGVGTCKTDRNSTLLFTFQEDEDASNNQEEEEPSAHDDIGAKKDSFLDEEILEDPTASESMYFM